MPDFPLTNAPNQGDDEWMLLAKIAKSAATSAQNSVNATQYESPVNAQTINWNNNSQNTLLWLTPAGPLASLTVNLPSEANSVVGQVLSIGSSQTVTDLVIQNATTIFNNVTTLSAGDLYAFKKVSPNTWARYAQ